MNQSDTEVRVESANRPRQNFWVALIPAFVLVICALAILTPKEVHEVTPPMQVASRRTVTSLPTKPKLKEPLVRVNVTPGGVDSFRLEVRGVCRWKPLETNGSFSETADFGNVVVSSGPNGLQVGSQSLSTNRIEIQAEQSPAIRVNGHLYRGSMRLYRRTDGKVSAINVLPVEEYLASVVDSEMPAKFPEAARRAQTIVARTYALYQVERADSNSHYDLLSSQRSQKYLGVEYLDARGRRLAGESENSRRVVQATRGLVCQRHGKLFCAYYSAVCGGQTTNGDLVFKDASDVVRTVPCDWCRESPRYRWTRELSREDFHDRVWDRDPGSSQQTKVRQLVEPGNGSISQFEIENGRERRKISGIELRERLPAATLLSPHVTIRMESDRVILEGRGHGHGVGFCQWGAKGQAEAGRSDREIVLHYYPGAELKTLDY